MAHFIRDFFFGKDARILDETGEVIHPLPPRMWADWDRRYFISENDWHQHQGATGLKEDLNLLVSEPKEPSEHLTAHEAIRPDWRREMAEDPMKPFKKDENEPWRWTSWLPWRWH